MTAETSVFLAPKEIWDNSQRELTLADFKALVEPTEIADGLFKLKPIATINCRFAISIELDQDTNPKSLIVIATEPGEHENIRSQMRVVYDLSIDNLKAEDFRMISGILSLYASKLTSI